MLLASIKKDIRKAAEAMREASATLAAPPKKKRKGGNREHLDKVGEHSHSAAVHEQQRERQAVLDTMGLGGSGNATRVIVWVVFAVLVKSGRDVRNLDAFRGHLGGPPVAGSAPRPS